MSTDKISRLGMVSFGAAAAVAIALEPALAQSPPKDVYGLRGPLRYMAQFTVDGAPSKPTIELVISPFCSDSARFVEGALQSYLKKNTAQGTPTVIFHPFARVESDVDLMVELFSYERQKLIPMIMNLLALGNRTGRDPLKSAIADAAKSVGAQKDPLFNAAQADLMVRKMNELMIKRVGIRATPTLFVNRNNVGFVRSESDLDSALAKFAKV